MFLGTETFSISMSAQGGDSVLAFPGLFVAGALDTGRAVVRAVEGGRSRVATESSCDALEAREVAGGGAA
jgi:hypothetical protein